MTKPTAAALARAKDVLAGTHRLSYEDVRNEHGLDDSFQWTPDLISPYVEASIDSRIRRNEDTILIGRLRAMAAKLRISPTMPENIIPLLQMAADRLEKK